MRTKVYAIVIGRLFFACILLVIRWLIFEPIYFIGVLLSTIGETGLNGLNSIINNIQKLNNVILKQIK